MQSSLNIRHLPDADNISGQPWVGLCCVDFAPACSPAVSVYGWQTVRHSADFTMHTALLYYIGGTHVRYVIVC